MVMRKTLSWVLASSALLALAGCMEGGTTSSDTASQQSAAGKTTTRLVERDVEAPKVFHVSEVGLWDGRPSLGGVWVAYPGVKDPERVIIRNPANGKFVIGALFRREREMPGPKLQVSSDTAQALGLLAGQPVKLDVTALRREEVAQPALAPAKPALDQAQTIATENLAPIATPATTTTTTTTAATPAPAPRAPAATPAPARPAATATAQGVAQIGMFSVEANARTAVNRLKAAGVPAEIKREESQGKTVWRVVAPPASGQSRDALLTKVKGAGFKDAYFVAR